MICAIASGKGGTGKTTVAVNLALSINGPVQLLDCDVEEPNCHLFLKIPTPKKKTASLPVPVVNREKCVNCGQCSRACRFHAIACLATGVLVYEELCHGCGGCVKSCPNNAMEEVPRSIGDVETGIKGHFTFTQGRLRIGQAFSSPLVRAVKQGTAFDGTTIIDCAPGTACPVVAALRGVDRVVLVTEPTPFGLHDFKLAVETVRHLKLPFGAVINRADAGDSRVCDYCQKENIPILMEIPDNRRVAEAYSNGQPAIEAVPELREKFSELGRRILEDSSFSKDGAA
ncbi:MAG: ATP-binding protein [Verrucomicrobiae bacterium]|nr:ATP-binding protein [Verrucomicrobiae bacterium]